MERYLKLSDPAIFGLEDIVEYLAREHGQKVADRFVAKLNKSLNALLTHPFTGVVCELKDGTVLRKKIVATYTVVLYQLRDNQIYVVGIVDGIRNWQDVV